MLTLNSSMPKRHVYIVYAWVTLWVLNYLICLAESNYSSQDTGNNTLWCLTFLCVSQNWLHLAAASITIDFSFFLPILFLWKPVCYTTSLSLKDYWEKNGPESPSCLLKMCSCCTSNFLVFFEWLLKSSISTYLIRHCHFYWEANNLWLILWRVGSNVACNCRVSINSIVEEKCAFDSGALQCLGIKLWEFILPSWFDFTCKNI